MKQAIRRAYQKFVRRHPRWVAPLFDEYFLMGKAVPLLASAQSDSLPEADELVAA